MASVPENISFVDAVASLEASHYAINFLRKLEITKEDKVLVLGGTGSSMIQLFSQTGCKIYSSLRPEHFEQVKQISAEKVVDYTKPNYLDQFKNKEFAHVLDSVGKSSFGSCKRLIKDNGIYISSELGPNSENPFLAIKDFFLRFKVGPKVLFLFPMDIQGYVDKMQGLLETGQFKPFIDRELHLTEAKQAYEYTISGQKFGNVVLKWRK